MNKLRIKRGDPQPVPCQNCEESHGYTLWDKIAISYGTNYNSDGTHNGGNYGDSERILNEATTPYCLNCGRRMKFKVYREHINV